MLTHPTLDKLDALRFTGMARALRDQLEDPNTDRLGFLERLGLLVDHEMTEREDKRLKSRLRRAGLRQSACIEDLDYRSGRGLDRALMRQLSTCEYVRRHHNVVITGPTGVGKSFVACALAHRACLEGHTARYARLSRLVDDLALARGDGRYLKLLAQLAKVEVLLLDDWGLSPLTASQQRDLLEVPWVIATRSARPSRRVNFRWAAGMKRWPIRRWPTPSSTGSSTTPTASN